LAYPDEKDDEQPRRVRCLLWYITLQSLHDANPQSSLSARLGPILAPSILFPTPVLCAVLMQLLLMQVRLPAHTCELQRSSERGEWCDRRQHTSTGELPPSATRKGRSTLALVCSLRRIAVTPGWNRLPAPGASGGGGGRRGSTVLLPFDVCAPRCILTTV
jgi:hypothetical protein